MDRLYKCLPPCGASAVPALKNVRVSRKYVLAEHRAFAYLLVFCCWFILFFFFGSVSVGDVYRYLTVPAFLVDAVAEFQP